MKKKPLNLQSKTIRGLLVAAVIVLLNILGVGEEQIGQTYDTIISPQGQKMERGKDMGLLGALLYSFYGRTKAKEPLKWGKEGKDEVEN